eukprot:Nk52_evm18s2568 gene=Nk52_evmTU18s2568
MQEEKCGAMMDVEISAEQSVNHKEGYKMPKTMPKTIAGLYPWTVLCILIVEASERLAFYGVTLLFTNYLQHMLGLSLNLTSSIKSAIQFGCFGTGIFGAFIADKYLGKYTTIKYFAFANVIGLTCLATSAYPFSFNTFPDAAANPPVYADADGAWAMYGFYIGAVLIAFGAGSIKACIGPYVVDQIVDADVSVVEIVMRYFYMAINMGGLFGLLWGPNSHVYGPKSISQGDNVDGSSYWLSYTVCAAFMFLATIVFLLGKNYYVNKLPNGTVYTNFYRVCKDAIKGGWENSSYSKQQVLEIRRIVNAFKLFIPMPIFFFAYVQMTDSFINQASLLDRPSWMGSEALSLFDAISIVIMVPVVNFLLPKIRRVTGWAFTPVTRVSIGYAVLAIAFAWVFVIERVLLNNGQYEDKGDKVVYVKNEDASSISIWVQVPAYIFVGLGEIFTTVTLLEVAYSQAPKDMKVMVMAMGNMTIALANLIQAFVGDFVTYRQYQTLFVVLGCVCIAMVFINYLAYRHFDFSSMNGADGGEGETTISDENNECEVIPAHTAENEVKKN